MITVLISLKVNCTFPLPNIAYLSRFTGEEEKKRETQTYPGQAPVTTQTYSSRTYQSGQPPIDESYGISDF
jgi:hypothetical protein